MELIVTMRSSRGKTGGKAAGRTRMSDVKQSACLVWIVVFPFMPPYRASVGLLSGHLLLSRLEVPVGHACRTFQKERADHHLYRSCRTGCLNVLRLCSSINRPPDVEFKAQCSGRAVSILENGVGPSESSTGAVAPPLSRFPRLPHEP